MLSAENEGRWSLFELSVPLSLDEAAVVMASCPVDDDVNGGSSSVESDSQISSSSSSASIATLWFCDMVSGGVLQLFEVL